MASETARRRLTVIERLLILGAVVCLGWCVFVVARAWRYQSRATPTASSAPATSMPRPSRHPWKRPPGRVPCR